MVIRYTGSLQGLGQRKAASNSLIVGIVRISLVFAHVRISGGEQFALF